MPPRDRTRAGGELRPRRRLAAWNWHCPRRMALVRAVAVPMLAVLLIFAYGTGGYVVLGDMGLSDAAYMTAITMSTVGFGEVQPLHGAARWHTATLIALSIVVGALAVSRMVRFVVEGELRDLVRDRRMEYRIRELRGHVIVCGYGRNGRQAAAMLGSRRIAVVVIDHDETLRQELTGPPEPFLVVGDATDDRVLENGGIANARGLISSLPEDAENVYVTLTARELRPDMMIVARADQESTRSKLLRAGATSVVVPSDIGGRRLAATLVSPTCLELVERIGGESDELHLDEVTIGDDTPLAGCSMKGCGLRERTNVTVVGLKKPDRPLIISPHPDENLGAGDILVALGTRADLVRLREIAGAPSIDEETPVL